LALKDEEAPEPLAAATMEIAIPQSAPPPVVTRSGRQSKTATPITSTFPADIPMARSRSTRNNSTVQNNASSSSNSNGSTAEPTASVPTKRSHKRGASSAKPTSVDNSRSTSKPGTPDPNRVPLSRHSSRTLASKDEERDEVEAGAGDEEELDDGDEVDENEPRYCYCDGVSYGDMIACDNDDCPKQWFHYSCVGLTKQPKADGKCCRIPGLIAGLLQLTQTTATWYCDFCDPKKNGREGKKSRPGSSRS
jgi:hypothetical protein